MGAETERVLRRVVAVAERLRLDWDGVCTECAAGSNGACPCEPGCQAVALQEALVELAQHDYHQSPSPGHAVELLPNGAIMQDGRMVARIVYADPGLSEAVRVAVAAHLDAAGAPLTPPSPKRPTGRD